jgi:hypothetical protein
MVELIVIVVFTILLAAAGYAIMLISEVILYSTARAKSFDFQAGIYNFRSAKRPHVLVGTHNGHNVVITYGLYDYFSEPGDTGVSSISYEVPEHRKIHFKMRPAFPIGKRRFPTGDRSFDLWVSVTGGPKHFILNMLSDTELRRDLKSVISPPISFTSTISLTRAGPLVIRHKSLFLCHKRIHEDLLLLARIAGYLEDYLSSTDESLSAERLAGADPARGARI